MPTAEVLSSERKTDMSRFLSKSLSRFDAYVPGEQPKNKNLIKLNTNESSYPPSKKVAEYLSREACDGLNRYPDLVCSGLRDSFCRVFGVSGNKVMFTNGSDEALYLSFLTFCDESRGVAFPDITYGFYTVYADLCGINKKIIPLDDELRVNPSNYVNLGRTIVIANPNAPTGHALSLDEISFILDSNKDNVVVIDEAYVDFYGVSCKSLLDRYQNLVVIGTFSKSRYLAGARLGYVIASPELIADLEKAKYSINPYNVNTMTQLAGKAALDDNEYYMRVNAEIVKTRDLFASELLQMGFEVLPSATNFVFAKYDGFSGEYLLESLRTRDILVRRFKNERIKDFVRITIGTPQQMRIVADTLREIVGGKK